MTRPASKRIKLVIAGCGRITDQHHLPAALRSSLVDVITLVDSNSARVRDVARKYALQVPLKARLEDALEGADGVLLATPNHTHAPLAKIVIARKIPVLIEKPLANSYAEAQELCRLADEEGAFISVGYRTRYYPAVVLMKDLIERGFFGRIRSFHYEFGSRGGWSPVSGFTLYKKQSGGGVLIDTGSHFVDRMLYWFGWPAEFEYEDDSYGGPEANCRCRLRFDHSLGPIEGTIVLSKTMALENKVSMATDDCICELGESETELLTLYPRSMPGVKMTMGTDAPSPRSRPDYFQVQIEDFARAILEGASPRVDGWSGARSVKLIEQMYARRRQMDEPWLLHGRESEIAG